MCRSSLDVSRQFTTVWISCTGYIPFLIEADTSLSPAGLTISCGKIWAENARADGRGGGGGFSGRGLRSFRVLIGAVHRTGKCVRQGFQAFRRF